jgi:hypothetical protein
VTSLQYSECYAFCFTTQRPSQDLTLNALQRLATLVTWHAMIGYHLTNPRVFPRVKLAFDMPQAAKYSCFLVCLCVCGALMCSVSTPRSSFSPFPPHHTSPLSLSRVVVAGVDVSLGSSRGHLHYITQPTPLVARARPSLCLTAACVLHRSVRGVAVVWLVACGARLQNSTAIALSRSAL